MPKTNLTIARSPRARRNQKSIDDLELQLRLAHAAIVMLGMQTPTSILTRSQRLRLADVSKRTGVDPESVMRRAVGNWLTIEAPIYLAQA